MEAQEDWRRWDRAVGFVSRLPHRWIVPGLLALFAAFATFSALRDSVTFDETAHLAAGYTYLDRWDFRLNPEHPPLAKMWAALPLKIAGLRDVDYSSPPWKEADEWAFGFAFLNGPAEDSRRLDPAARLVPARLMMILLGVLLGLVVYFWSKELWGPGGALIALLLYSFSPTVLAHARLVTTDLPVALGFATTLWCFWRFCRKPGWLRAGLAGLALAMALLAKFSAVLLLPLLGGLWIFWAFMPAGGAEERRRRLLRGAGALAAMGLIAVGCIWAAYGFRYAMRRSPPAQSGSTPILVPPEPVASTVEFARSHRLLPEGYLSGFSTVAAATERRTFINGRVLSKGVWYYFPEAVLLKTTPSLLLIGAWLSIAGLLRTRARSFKGWFLGAPAAFYFLVAIAAGLNIGHRHLLPVYVLLFVAAGALPRLCPVGRWRQMLLAALLAGHAVSSLGAFPRYLSYFNLAAGGAERGWRFFGDSSFDWGQDLMRLKEKMEEHRIPHVYLFYSGTGDPRALGISYRKSRLHPDFRPQEPNERPGPGDCAAVSASLLYLLEGREGEALRTRFQPFDKAGDSIFLYRFPGRPPADHN